MPILPAIANISFPEYGFILLLAVSALLFLHFLKRMGIFSKLVFEKLPLVESEYLYLQFKGPYGQLSTVYDKLIEDTASKKLQFKPTGMMGISYDDPRKTEPSGCRSVVGILLPKAFKQELSEFTKTHPQYKTKLLEPTTLLKTEIPMINKLSFLLLPFKVIPGLMRHITQNKIDINGFQGVIEIYGMPQQKIVVGVPLINQSQFNLSTYPKHSKTE